MPHFVLVCLMRRQVPKLYRLLANGHEWLFQDRARNMLSSSPERAKRYYDYLVYATAPGSQEANKQAHEQTLERYFDALSSCLQVIRVPNPGEQKPDYNFTFKGENKDLPHRPFSDPRHTGTYFTWRTDEEVYSDQELTGLLSALEKESESSRAAHVRAETERISTLGKLSSFLETLSAMRRRIREKELSGAFLQGLLSAKTIRTGTDRDILRAGVLFLSDARLGAAPLASATAAVDMIEHPLLLLRAHTEIGLLMRQASGEMGNEWELNEQKRLRSHIASRISAVLDNKCPFEEFGLQDAQILELLHTVDPSQAANYLRGLAPHHPESTDRLIQLLEKTRDPWPSAILTAYRHR
jgi:hypothetical protein